MSSKTVTGDPATGRIVSVRQGGVTTIMAIGPDTEPRTEDGPPVRGRAATHPRGWRTEARKGNRRTGQRATTAASGGTP